ncbi:lantibiotic dehydratase [Streptomyces sp. I05A-00742]|uniref:lantibiotic dehydratase n=1 Tax=Streptomyces sp. I05A-00742 TaxID=2732853 RepID=UPI002017E873|nr:lantibiotic dehydratase [Streptomyces sp. I05A-00742]
MPGDHFDIAEPLLVRMASTPREELRPQAAAGSPTGMRELAADPLLREAIQVASTSLADRLDELDAGAVVNDRRATSAALSVTRYALRAGGRPTPFGLFAGVSPASIGDTAHVDIRGPGRKQVRLDAEWLDAHVRDLLASPTVRREVTVVLNDLCHRRGERLVLPTAEGETTLRRTALVALLTEAAASPVAYHELLDNAATAFPDIAADDVDTVLAQLVRHDFLLTSITPLDLGAEALDRVETALATAPEAAATFRRIRDGLRAYELTAPGKGSEAWRRALRPTGSVTSSGRPPIHVDLRMDADIRLPRIVAQEAEAYASAMWAISPEGRTHAHMRRYCDRFLEKYGTDALVPLGELVDRHRGLGFPDTYGSSPADDGSPSERPDEPRERRLLTAELVHDALLQEERELRLTPQVIDRIAATGSAVPTTAPPYSLELCFQILADNVTALDQGDFRLIGSRHSGSWTAGATSGRFAELTGLAADLSRLMSRPADEGVLPAQVVFRPLRPMALNLVQVPPLLPHRIPVGVHADPGRPDHLDWRRLLVRATTSRLLLVDERTGRQVLPVVPHMVRLDREAPHVVRLLGDISHDRPRNWHGWNWCGLETLPVLPRVTFGRVTAAPLRWLPDRRVREAASAPEQWDDAVRRWQERYRVPDQVQIVREDRVYGVDLTSQWHRTLLRDEVRTGPGVIIAEDPAADGRGLGWAQGHSTEVVFPFVRRRPADAARPTGSARATSTGIRHLPGEEWLSVKLYAAADTHDELLRAYLPGLLRDVVPHTDHGFFIRYRDPEAHLRLRFHGVPATLRSIVLPELARHARAMQDAGAVRAMVLDSYAPETDRYGGEDALPAAERLFCLDSQSALAHLTLLPHTGSTVPSDVLSAAHHALLLESLGDWDWCSWAGRVFPKRPAHRAFQRVRSYARNLVRPGQVATAIGERLAAPSLARLWTDAPETRAYGRFLLAPDGSGLRSPAHERSLLSLLHMQHNRLFGIDPAHEERGYAILRGAARDHLARRDREART